MDIREFSDKIAQATKNMSEDERQSLMKMFETVSDEIASVPKASAQASAGQNSGVADSEEKQPYYSSTASATTEVDADGVPLGPTERLVKLKKIRECQKLFCAQNALSIAAKPHRL